MLPAEYGDCLWIEYGPDGGKVHRVLVDAGTPDSYPALQDKIKSLKATTCHFELFVITHIDADHIGGAIKLLKDRQRLGVEFDDIWFNGYRHLPVLPDDILGVPQAEEVTDLIDQQGLPWNKAFGGKAVSAPDAGPFPVKPLPGGLQLTVLGPTTNELRRLRIEWDKVVAEAELEAAAEEAAEEEGEDILGEEELDIEELASSKFVSDRAVANLSSIVLVAEYDGERILLGADAHVGVVMKALDRLTAEERGRIGWLKLPHHGSRANISNELLQKLACKGFLVSTNGKRFRHPNKEAIARVIKGAKRPRIYFNYRGPLNEKWDDADLITTYGYRVSFPSEGRPGLTVKLSRARRARRSG